MSVARHAPLSVGFSRQEYWSGLPFPPLGDLPDPGIKPTSLKSPTLAVEFFTTSTTWEAHTSQDKTWGYYSRVFSTVLPIEQLWAPLCREFAWGRQFKLTPLDFGDSRKRNENGYFFHSYAARDPPECHVKI